MNEYIGLAIACRVQKQIKLKRPTKLVTHEYVVVYGHKVPPLNQKVKCLKHLFCMEFLFWFAILFQIWKLCRGNLINYIYELNLS